MAVTLKYLPKASSWHIMMIFCQVCNGSNEIHESYLEMNLYFSEFFIKKKRFLWDLDICANVVNFKDTFLLCFYLRQLWNLVTFIWGNVQCKIKMIQKFIFESKNYSSVQKTNTIFHFTWGTNDSPFHFLTFYKLKQNTEHTDSLAKVQAVKFHTF